MEHAQRLVRQVSLFATTSASISKRIAATVACVAQLAPVETLAKTARVHVLRGFPLAAEFASTSALTQTIAVLVEQFASKESLAPVVLVF